MTVHGCDLSQKAEGICFREELSPTLCAGTHGGHGAHAVGDRARRLSPEEWERLQGFPTGWTALPSAPEGDRYRSLGNSMAVAAMRWIGSRVAS